MLRRLTVSLLLSGGLALVLGQNEQTPQTPAAPPQTQSPGGLKQRDEAPAAPGALTVAPGTHILLNMINSVSTKQAQVGDRIYLETAFPVLSGSKIVIPQGSWVIGTVTDVKRPGRMMGRGQLQVRFDSLTLPNGVTRNFRSDLGSVDGRSDQDFNREKGKIGGPGDKKGDVGTVIGTTIAGTAVGTGIGAAAGGAAKGAGIGAGAGAAAGLLAVMLTRGPDATLTKGSTVEMVLDRPVAFQDTDLDFSKAPPRATLSEGSQSAPPARTGLTPRTPW
jgi:hypothetical protein